MFIKSESPNLNFKKIFFLFISAFLIRSSVFLFYIQHNERYCQSDSMDYHVGAISIAHGMGMHRPDTLKPIFWRTPGYPAYLAFFYNIFGLSNFGFSENSKAQKASIWVQIFLSSFLPILIFILSFLLTNSYFISWVSAVISIFNLGFILTSTYLLTDSLSLLFFIIFLIFFFNIFKNLNNLEKIKYWQVLISALSLALFTWFRPMGQFIAIISGLLFFITGSNFKQKLKIFFLFILTFFISISPWYIRNYNLTGKFFFCPLFGPYLTLFNAPKIKSRTDNLTLKESHKLLSYAGGKAAQEDILKTEQENRINKTNLVTCTELSALKVALPIIFAHPFYFLLDWLTEVIKTTFDLYSSQLVAFAANRFKWDPLIEYLPEKIAECLYKQDMPIFMRLICWLEFLFNILLWIGLLSGIYFFILVPIFNWSKINSEIKKRSLLWLASFFIIGITVGMSGGFGYARLRLPIEPIFITLTLQAWVYIVQAYREKFKSSKLTTDSYIKI